MSQIPLAGRPLALALAALSLAACDTTGVDGDAFVYATPGTDAAVDLVQDAQGRIVVVGSVEGRPRPADGTLAFPAVLRFDLDGALASAEVYRDLGFGAVVGAATTDGGLVVSVASGPDEPGGSALRVLRTDERGARGPTVLDVAGGYAPPRSVVPLPDGGLVVAIDPGVADRPQLYRFDADGAQRWAVRVEGVQGLTAVAPAPDGGVYVIGWGAEGGVLARIRPDDGTAVWRRAAASEWTPSALAATADGVAVAEARSRSGQGSAVRVVRYGAADGAERGAVEVARSAGAYGDGNRERPVSSGPVAALPDGRLAVGWMRVSGGLESPPDAFVSVVGEAVGPVWRFGREGRWPALNALTVLADGRVAAAGALGPARVTGYGGDDFDVWVALYDPG
ncbi:hypothetical protein [Rubrivirga sp.]|uniref:hypothetical protein n=1 Tax=Rubrivirga sp. TaxID=1885344 RepID=UPI003B52B4CC